LFKHPLQVLSMDRHETSIPAHPEPNREARAESTQGG
jgi:hypothetical protein